MASMSQRRHVIDILEEITAQLGRYKGATTWITPTLWPRSVPAVTVEPSGKVIALWGDIMQWLIIARDGTDDDAPKRRLKARPAHLEHAAKLQAAGHLIVGGALTDNDGQMNGTAAVAQFATRAELDHWLTTDPYVTGDVWREIEVHPYRVAPHYHVPDCPESLIANQKSGEKV